MKYTAKTASHKAIIQITGTYYVKRIHASCRSNIPSCIFLKMEEKLMQSQIFPWDKIAQRMSSSKLVWTEVCFNNF